MGEMRRPKYLSATQIAAMAAGFRRQYADGEQGALDIEVILEADLQLEIIPKLHLTRATGMKAWLSCDGRTIFVDEGLMCGSQNEYRFTIAHEAAHAVLHKELLPEQPFRNSAEFWEYHQRLTPKDNYFLEWQARQWAGQVLVPPDELAVVFQCVLDRALVVFGRPMDVMTYFVEQEVAEHFGVTGSCARVRLNQDELWRSVGIAA